MSQFWQGFWALPLGALALGAAILLVFGSWLALEKWAERRWLRQKVEWEQDEKTGEAWLVDKASRDNSAMLVALAPHVTRIRLFFGVHILIVSGTQRIPRPAALRAAYGYERAMDAYGSNR